MLTPSLEDYLEEMYKLSIIEKDIRVRDIADSLNVSSPSVVNALNKLNKSHYVKYIKYEEISLTDKGKKLGELLVKRNRVLQEFLTVIGSECDIEEEAEAMEHYLTPPTILCIEKFVIFMNENRDVLKKFRQYDVKIKNNYWDIELSE